MGSCVSSDSTKDIDKNMKKDKQRYKKLIKILLLGPGDSGKTTIVKQMKKIHHGNIETDELLNFRSLIRKQILDIMSLLSKESLSKNQDLGDLNDVRDKLAQDMLIEELELIDDVDEIKKLWLDKKFNALRENILLPENSDYFLDRIDQINEKDYIPSFNDYLRCRVETTGYNSEKFDTLCNGEKVPMEIIDVGGQRSERRKWMSVFQDDMDAVLYIFGLGGYDKVLYEDCTVNRLHEALSLFEEVKMNGMLENKTVVLFFNKYDLFQAKISKIPITVAFEDYPKNQDAKNEQQVIEFVLNKFEVIYKRIYEKNRQTKKIELKSDNQNMAINKKRFFMHATTALDTDLIMRLMNSIQLALVMENVQRTGVF